MAVLLFFLWLLLFGKVTAEIVAIGILVSAAVYVLLIRVAGYPWKKELLFLRSIPFGLLYLLNLLWETWKAAATVARLGITHKAQPEPVLVEFHSGLKRDSLNVILANSITLTPGTITVFQDGDRFLVHALRKEYAEGIDDSSFIQILRRFPQ